MTEAAQRMTPDKDEILRDLQWFTRRWHELSEPVWLEIRPINGQGQTRATKYRTDPESLEAAASFCAGMNTHGYNVYAVRNPIRDSVGASAKDADIAASFFLWADCDDDPARDNVLRFSAFKASAIVRTGRVPSDRVHFYWELDEPVRNMTAWSERQSAIAAHFGSDATVINPSRIMRVAGTVTYPAAHKIARGYVPEMAALRTEFPDDRDPISFERALQVWPAAPAWAIRAGASAFDVDTGPAPLDRERARIQALSGAEWHNAVIRLVASYVAKGLADGEIHALTDPLTLTGYTVDQTRREVQVAIDGARRKGWTPEVGHEPNFDWKPAGEAGPEVADGWRIQTAGEFVAGFVAPEWLVEGVIQRGRLYTLTAPTGHAKTATMLYVGAQISQGGEVCGLETEQGDVLFMAGENPDDVRARVIIAMDRYGIDPATARLHFIPGTFSIRADMDRLSAAASTLPDLALIVVDTFAAYFDGDDENSNAQALDFARVVRSLTALPSRPAVVMPAHPVKNAGKGNLIPKGGSSLLNEVDGNLTVWKDDAVATIHWQGKIRGPEFEPMQLEIVVATHSAVHDKRGVLMPSVVAMPVPPARARQIARDTMSREDAVLVNVADYPLMSFSERCVHLRGPFVSAAGVPAKSAMFRTLAKLEAAKLIRAIGGSRERRLTPDGETVVERLRRGEASVSDEE